MKRLPAVILFVAVVLHGGAHASASGLEAWIAGRNVPYRTVGARTLHVDVYRAPTVAVPRPAIVFFHGGGWKLGNKADAIPELGESPTSAEFGRRWPSMLPYVRRGYALVSVEYRLSSEARAPAAIEDALAALDWIGAHGVAHGIDPARLIVAGPSAGGHLALIAGLTHRTSLFRDPPATTPTRVRGIIDLYGISDVRPFVEGAGATTWAHEWIPSGTGRTAMAALTSPITHVTGDAPPLLAIHGTRDATVPFAQSERIVEQWTKAGAPGRLVRLADAIHGFFTEAELATIEEHIVAFLDGVVPIDHGT